MTLVCQCGVTCKIPSLPTARLRCGKCRREFTPADLVRAKSEPPPVRPKLSELIGLAPPDDFELEAEDDVNLDTEDDFT